MLLVTSAAEPSGTRILFRPIRREIISRPLASRLHARQFSPQARRGDGRPAASSTSQIRTCGHSILGANSVDSPLANAQDKTAQYLFHLFEQHGQPKPLRGTESWDGGDQDGPYGAGEIYEPLNNRAAQILRGRGYQNPESATRGAAIGAGSSLTQTGKRSTTWAQIQAGPVGVEARRKLHRHRLRYRLAGDVLKGGPNHLQQRSSHDWKTSLADPMERARDLAWKSLSNPFKKALEAMQEQDSRKLLIRLAQIVTLPTAELVEAAAALPRTTFSEFLRCLDPLIVGPENDPMHGENVNFGMYLFLNMGQSIDEYGIRRLYTRLLQRLLVMTEALIESGHHLWPEDYIPLLRAAGAAADPMGAAAIWKRMRFGSTSLLRNSRVHHEFIKARFLTDPLYGMFDKTRYMVHPRNLHGYTLNIPRSTRRRLDILRSNRHRHAQRFGMDREAERQSFPQHLHRLTRRRLPIVRVFSSVLSSRSRLDERLLCDMMIALARTGNLDLILQTIFKDHFGISIDPPTDESDWVIRPTEKMQGRIYLRPSEILLKTAVESLCMNAELSLAFKLVDYISTRYRVPVQPQIWYDLMEWTYILSSKTVREPLKWVGMGHKIPSQQAIQMVWDTMTAEPYNVQPRFQEYNVLIRSLLQSHRLQEAIRRIKEASTFYESAAAEYDAAVFEYVATVRDGVDATTAFRRYQRARFMKQRIWHGMNLWCRALMLRFRPMRSTFGLTHPFVTTKIQDFVRDFAPFMPNPTRYQTPTGYVTLLDPGRERHYKYLTDGDDELDVSVLPPGYGKPEFVRRTSRKFYNLSSRSLSARRSVKLDPFQLLRGGLTSFRAPSPRGGWSGRDSQSPQNPEPEDDLFDDD